MSWNKRHTFWAKRQAIPLLSLWLLMVFPAWGQEERVANPSFDGSFDSKGITSGWEDNSSWAPVEVRYQSDNPGFGGRGTCQQIEVVSFRGGAVQFVSALTAPVGRYRMAKISLALKGDMPTPVEVQLRKRGSPYTTFITRSFSVTEAWQSVGFEELLPESADDMIAVIRLTGVGTVWVDEFHVTESALSGPNPFRVLTPPAKPVSGRFFGQHTHNHRYPEITWPQVPFQMMRFWDSRTAWSSLEPQKGEWAFERLDRLVSLCQSSNVEMILTMALTPAWASARPEEKSAYSDGTGKGNGYAAEAADIEDWKNYVRTVGTRYKGKLRYFEMWNEPNNNVLPLAFFTGSQKKLADLCREAYGVLKSIDPENQIISPSVVGNAAYVDGFLRAGGKGTFDKVGYHFYTGYHSKSVYGRAPERSIAEVLRVKRVLEQHGIASTGIWNTEAGWYAESAKKPETAPVEGKPSEWVPLKDLGDLIARLYLLQWAQGIEAFCFYAWDNGNMGLLESDGSPKPGALAYRNIYTWMVGNTMVSCEADDEDNWVATFKNPGGSFSRVVWREKGTSELNVGRWKANRVKGLYGSEDNIRGKSTLLVTGSPQMLE